MTRVERWDRLVLLPSAVCIGMILMILQFINLPDGRLFMANGAHKGTAGYGNKTYVRRVKEWSGILIFAQQLGNWSIIRR